MDQIQWDPEVDEVRMHRFLCKTFNKDAKQVVDMIAPMLLSRALMRSSPDHNLENCRIIVRLKQHKDTRMLNFLVSSYRMASRRLSRLAEIIPPPGSSRRFPL